MSGKTFMLMAGGTGGHIFPALAVAESLQKRGHHVIWLGSQGFDGRAHRAAIRHTLGNAGD